MERVAARWSVYQGTPLISERFVMRASQGLRHRLSRNRRRRRRRCRRRRRRRWHRLTPDKPRMQIEISSCERWMTRPVINGPRDIRPADFFTAARFMLATY